jgi:hypothetical protein
MQALQLCQADDIYRAAVERYIATRREKLPDFTRQHFSFAGSRRLHRHALGWDLLKGPVNAGASVLSIVQALGAKALSAGGATLQAARIKNRTLFLNTEVSRELNRLICVELLELPIAGCEDAPFVDALMQEILQAPEIQHIYRETLATLSAQTDYDLLQQRLTDTFADYANSRAAAADIAVTLVSAAAGFALLHKVTPGLASLSAGIAQSLAHSLAVNSYWAGPWAGKLYYTLAGVSVTPLFTVGTLAGILVPAALVATFSGIVTDPIQLKLGLHDRRLNALLDNLELTLLGEAGTSISVKEHYIARIFDVMDWLYMAAKTIKP